MKIGILASGTGTNAQAIIDKAAAGILDATVEVVFSNRPGAKVLERATAAGIPAMALDHASYGAREDFDLALTDILRQFNCDTVVLAGYMRLLSREFLDAFSGSVLNIHPALLPSFPGLHGARDALAYGVKLSGPSVHFVDEQMDSGPLIIQAAVPVKAGENVETLQQRIHALEHRIYPQALQWLAQGRLSVRGRQVFLADSDIPKVAPEGNWFVWPPLEKGF